nr:hypothetical protein [Enterobacter mori]
MSTALKEWLKHTIAELEEERDAVHGVVNEDATNALAAMKIALASLKADDSGRNPVQAYADSYRDMAKQGVESIPVWSVITDLERNIAPLFTAPPAPVSVPTFDEWLEIRGNKPLGWVKDAMRESYDACRAAMLQGADDSLTHEGKNHPEDKLAMVDHLGDANEKVDCRLPFYQWLSQQNEPIDVDCGCVTTEAFFHWLRIAYEAGNSPVAPDDWQLVPKQITLEMECALSRADSYEIGWRWALAAAPLQEVDNG